MRLFVSVVHVVVLSVVVVHGSAVAKGEAPLRARWPRGTTHLELTRGTTTFWPRSGRHQVEVGHGRPWQLAFRRGKQDRSRPVVKTETTARVEIRNGQPTLQSAGLKSTFTGCSVDNPVEIGRGIALGRLGRGDRDPAGATPLGGRTSDLVDSRVRYVPSTFKASYTRGAPTVTTWWTGRTDVNVGRRVGVPSVGGGLCPPKLVLPLARIARWWALPGREEIGRQGGAAVGKLAPELSALWGKRLSFKLGKLDGAKHCAVGTLRPGTYRMFPGDPKSRFPHAFRFRVPEPPKGKEGDDKARLHLEVKGAVATGKAAGSRDGGSVRLLDRADVSVSSVKVGVTFDRPVLVDHPLSTLQAFKAALRGESTTLPRGTTGSSARWRRKLSKRLGLALPASWDFLYTLSLKELSLEATELTAPRGVGGFFRRFWSRLWGGARGQVGAGSPEVRLKLRMKAHSRLLDRWTFRFNRTKTATLRAADFDQRTEWRTLLSGLDPKRSVLSAPPGRLSPLAALFFQAVTEPSWNVGQCVKDARPLSSMSVAAGCTLQGAGAGQRMEMATTSTVTFESKRAGVRGQASLKAPNLQGEYAFEGSHDFKAPRADRAATP